MAEDFTLFQVSPKAGVLVTVVCVKLIGPLARAALLHGWTPSWIAMVSLPEVGKQLMPRSCQRPCSTSAKLIAVSLRQASRPTGVRPNAGKKTYATHTKKHGKGYFGYKLSVSVDHKHGFIRGVATGTASEYDGHHFDEVLDLHNTGKQVDTDKGYASRQRQAMLKALGFKDGIQRKAQPNQTLSACQQRRNKAIAKRRAKVEHVFAGIRHMGGKSLRSIGQARVSATMTLMAACYNLKRLASFLVRGVDSFFRSKSSKTEVRLQTANR